MSPSELRADAIGVTLGVLLVALGIAATVLFFLRSRNRDKAWLWLGLFAGLYGIRLLAVTPVIVFMAQPVPERFWPYLEAVITYWILVPVLLFVREIAPAPSQGLRWPLRVAIAFACAGMLADVILQRPQSLRAANNILVLVFGTMLVVRLMNRNWRATGQRTPLIGLLIFSFTALLANLSSLSVIRLPMNPEPIGFAIFLAALGSVAAKRSIQNDERLVALDKELEIARKIQASILPRSPSPTRGLEIATRYVPMAAVAGDFYDFLAVDGNRLGILIADVSGHGVPAALIASMVKIAFSTQLSHASDPARVLTGMNQTLYGKFKGQFVTAAYLFIDVEAGTMRYASAGHPPLLYLRNQPEEVVQNGLALGLRARSEYAYVERPVMTGDRLLLYTDGLLEARNATGDLYGDQRLREAMAQGPTLNPEQFAAHLLDRLRRWTGADKPLDDDVTFIVVKVV